MDFCVNLNSFQPVINTSSNLKFKIMSTFILIFIKTFLSSLYCNIKFNRLVKRLPKVIQLRINVTDTSEKVCDCLFYTKMETNCALFIR